MSASRKITIILMVLAATAAFSTASVRTDYGTLDGGTLIGSTIWTSEPQPGWVPGNGSVLDFAADGTGVSYESLNSYSGLSDPGTIPQPFTWSIIDNSVLEILYDDFAVVNFIGIMYPYQDLVDIYGFDQEVADFLNQAYENGQFDPPSGQVEVVIHTISSTSVFDTAVQDSRRVFWTTKRVEYSIDEALTSLNWPGTLPRGIEFSDFEWFVYLPAAISNGLQNSPSPGDTWAVPHLYRPLDSRLTEESPQGWFIDVFTLHGLGATSAGILSQQSYTWSATADGLVLESGNERYTYLPIETDGSNYLSLVSYAVNGDVQLRSAQWIARGDGTGGAMVADLVQPIPLYWQSGINGWISDYYDEDGRLLPSQVFGYSLADDGTSFRIFAGGANCVADEFDACFSAEGEPLWTWTADGDTIVREKEQDFLERSRTWTVLRYQPGGRAVALEWAVWQYPPEPWFFAINPRLTTLEVHNLSGWPQEWADADGLYPDDDSDGDGIADAADNCLQYASTDLRDTDGDGIGNVCDSDLNQDCMVNFLDLGIMKSVFFTTQASSNWNPDADLNGDNSVNFVDLGIIKGDFFTPPGPSGVPNLCD